MLTEVMRHYSLKRPPVDVGFFETEHHVQIARDLKASIQGGRLDERRIERGETVRRRR